MSEFFERKSVPKWRLVFYGVLATGSIAATGFFLNDRTLMISAVFFGVVIAGFGFVLDTARTNTRPQGLKIGRWLIYAGLLVASALKLWDLLPKQ